MTTADWKSCMSDLFDGLERELPDLERAAIVPTLSQLRSRVMRCTPQRRKKFEAELEAFLQSSITLQVAAQKYISRILLPTVEAAEAVLKESRALLKRFKHHG